MVSIRAASEKAATFAEAALGPNRTKGLRLEEVESSVAGGEDVWLITLSMVDSEMDVLEGFPAALRKRVYKTFAVRKSDGDVISMKIRELADV